MGGVDEVGEGIFHDVAEVVFGIDVVVAGIEVAVVFEGESVAASFAEDTEGGVHAGPCFEGGIEHLDEDFSDVFPDPFVEDVGEEFSVLEGADGPLGNDCLFCVGCDEFEFFFGGVVCDAFDDGDELYESAADFF